MSESETCSYCEGLGYIDIRDCSGQIQREETCSFCEGLGYLIVRDKTDEEQMSEYFDSSLQ